MARVTRLGTKRRQISLLTSSRSTIGVAATPRSATSRRLSSCMTGSQLSRSEKRRHEALPLEDEKPREPHLVQTTGRGPFQQFAMPGGPAAFAVTWEIATTEKEPRVILAYPSPSGV